MVRACGCRNACPQPRIALPAIMREYSKNITVVTSSITIVIFRHYCNVNFETCFCRRTDSFHILEEPFSLICSCLSVLLGLTFDHHKPADILKTTNTTWIGENGREAVFSFTLSSCTSILRATNSTPLLLSYQRMMNTNFRSLSLCLSPAFWWHRVWVSHIFHLHDDWW